MNLYVWLATFLGAVSVSSAVCDWDGLKRKLRYSDDNSVAQEIARNWFKRPADFFQEIDESSWHKIIPFLSSIDIANIKREDFKSNKAACRPFALYLHNLSNAGALPRNFRSTIYELVKERDNSELDTTFDFEPSSWIEGIGIETIRSLTLEESSLGKTSFAPPNSTENYHLVYKKPQIISRMINYIPPEWIKKDGAEIMKFLVALKPPQLGLLNQLSLKAILQNPKDACNSITVESLQQLSIDQLSLMTPACMAAINGLGELDLSGLIYHLPSNVFATYNGPLSSSTINGLSSHQLKAFGSILDIDTLICTALELHKLSPSAMRLLTARCLYGYLHKKWEAGFEAGWFDIPLTTLLQFNSEMQSKWINIFPDDFEIMPVESRKILMSNIQVCSAFPISFLSENVLQELPALCLYEIFARNDGPIRLGRLWQLIPISTLAYFSDDMLRILEKVAVEEFTFMSPSLLQIIFRSDTVLASLSKLLNHIILNPTARELVLTRERFTTLAKVAPNLAGQLLLLCSDIPADILADCEGQVIRNITSIVPGMESFEWPHLLSQLERKEKHFRQIFELMSSKASTHICATLGSFGEYFSIGWMRRNMNATCMSALRFDRAQISIMLNAPELIEGNAPWKAMLETYALEHWIYAFTTQNLPFILGDACGFWISLLTRRQDILRAIGYDYFRTIRPHCFCKLQDVLRYNSELVPILASDAFAFYQVEELPFDLSKLSPEQIGELSKFAGTGLETVIMGEQIESLTSVRLKEVLSLECNQLKVLFASPWIYISEEVASGTFEYLFQLASNRLKNAINNQVAVELDTHRIQPHFDPVTVQALDNLLDVYSTAKANRPWKINCPSLKDLLDLIKSCRLRQRFVNMCFQYPPLKPLVVGLARNADELRVYLQNPVEEENLKSEMAIPELFYDYKLGFKRADVLALIRHSPEIFIKSIRILGQNGSDNRLYMVHQLISQILTDIKRDLTVLGPAVSQLHSTGDSRWGNRRPTGTADDRLTSYVESKFIWGISREVGFIAGITLGKALIMDIRLSFVLDSQFYLILTNPTDAMIEAYYFNSYAEEMEDYDRNIELLINPTGFFGDSIRDAFSELDSIRYFNLPIESSSNGPDKVKFEIKERRWDRLKLLHSQVLTEFKAFVKEFLRGIGYALPLFKEFPSVPIGVLSPVAEFLPSLLNAVFIRGENLLENITFYDNDNVPSFIEGSYIMSSKLFTSFIRCLDKIQLERLLVVWTGVSTPSLKYSSLKVKFLRGFAEERLTSFDFCKASRPVMTLEESADGMITSSNDYRILFSKIIRQTFGPKLQIAPVVCPVGGAAAEFIPISISACQRELYIVLQPAHMMLNSLIHLLSAPLGY